MCVLKKLLFDHSHLIISFLIHALYGHPEAGAYWERHCEKKLLEEGFELVDNWPSCYWHPRLRLFLIVYVDDFKMAGPRESLAEGWRLVRKNISTDDPTPFGRFLGCEHVIHEFPCASAHGGKIRVMEYNMQHQIEQTIPSVSGVARF